MANTWIATPISSEERIAQFRSSDFDPVTLWEKFGDVAVFDLTDGMRLLYTITDSGRLNRNGDPIVRVDDEPRRIQ